MITLKDAKQQQITTQEQGKRLLQYLPIEAICSKYGEYKLGGSYLYGLMLPGKLDIDGYILTNEVTLKNGLALFDDLIRLDAAKRVALEKNLEGSSAQEEPSLVLQVKVLFEERLWNLDIHLIHSAEFAKFSYLNQQQFSEDQRDTMLLLKHWLKERGLYPGSTKLPNSFASVDVYRAVLEDNVRTVDEMIKWGSGRKTAADTFRSSH
jgi:hypothetical protein